MPEFSKGCRVSLLLEARQVAVERLEKFTKRMNLAIERLDRLILEEEYISSL